MKSDNPSKLEPELPSDILPTPYAPWPDRNFRLSRSVCSGAFLGAIAGSVSLLANVIGSLPFTTSHGVAASPVRLIQIYLTFLIGDRALVMESGLVLAAGCVAYLAIGALYGMLLETLVEYFLPRAQLPERVIVFSGLSLVIWMVNFYGIMLWLQPLAFKRTYIVELIPWWVAAATHLLFGLTMAVLSVARLQLREPID